MKNGEAILELSLFRICQKLQRGDVTSEALVNNVLDQIRSVNPKLNAVIQLDPGRALKEARLADRARLGGESLRPLHGVPMTVKDSFDTEGLISTGGTVGRRNFIPDRDATVIRRLRRAGAIVVGKTNTPELTLSYQTNNAIYGRTNNPYDTSRTSGGSSGGSAAIVASGAVPFDIGSDTGGSLRIPAHYCGIAALKPTEGRVPRTGHIISYGGHLDRLTTIGPIARFVEDLGILLPIIAGPDGHDPAITPVPLGRKDNVQFNSLKVAVHVDNGVAEPTVETIEAVHNAARILKERKCQIEEVAIAHAPDAPRLFAELYAADGGAWRRRILAAAGTIDESAVEDDSAKELRGAQFSALLEKWDRFRSEMLEFFGKYDLILCPVTAEPAPLHDQGVASAFSYTQIFSLTGWPSVVVRAGMKGHLPIGIQIVARPWREDVALRVAHCIETEMGGWIKPGRS